MCFFIEFWSTQNVCRLLHKGAGKKSEAHAPLSNFVALRSIRKLRMAVKIPRAAKANHSIPHTASKQHLSFKSHPADTSLMVSFTYECVFTASITVLLYVASTVANCLLKKAAVWCLHVLPEHAWVFSRHSAFLTHSKDTAC